MTYDIQYIRLHGLRFNAALADFFCPLGGSKTNSKTMLTISL